MFDYSFVHWVTFFTAAALLNLSPGPDMAFVLGQTASHGRKGGFAAMFGVWAGSYLHVIMAAVGLSAVIAASALAFSLIKWVGAAYLVWIGLQAIFSKSGKPDASSKKLESRYWSIFRQGAIVSAMNPKVAIFFLAFLPQFVVDGAGPVAAQLFMHGTLVVLVAAFIEPPMILISSRLTDYYRNNERFSRWMQRSIGTLFVALGVRLAIIER